MPDRRCPNRPRRHRPDPLHPLDLPETGDPEVELDLDLGRSEPRPTHPTAMRLHPDIAYLLRPEVRGAVERAVDILDADFIEEIAERTHGFVPLGGPTMAHLPDRHNDLYDLTLVRRWYLCFVAVTERLAHGWTFPRCLGEELALRAVIECARAQLELDDLDRPDSFDDLEDELFEDLDHLLLWDLDITVEPADAELLGIAPLHPSTWFEPFRPLEPVHPLAQRTDLNPTGDHAA